MRILIHIDQKASIAAGEEAPRSTEYFELPVASIPETMRLVVADNYNVYKGHLLINGAPIKVAKPVTEEKVLASLTKLYRDWLDSRAETGGGK